MMLMVTLTQTQTTIRTCTVTSGWLGFGIVFMLSCCSCPCCCCCCYYYYYYYYYYCFVVVVVVFVVFVVVVAAAATFSLHPSPSTQCHFVLYQNKDKHQTRPLFDALISCVVERTNAASNVAKKVWKWSRIAMTKAMSFVPWHKIYVKKYGVKKV